MAEKSPVDKSPPPSYVAWGGSMREVPDMLIAAQLSLRPLAKGEAPPTAEEARRIVGDACDLLHLALTNVLQVTRSIPSLAAVHDPNADLKSANDGSPPDERQSSRGTLFELKGDRGRSNVDRLSIGALPNPFCSLESFATRLTDEQLDRLNRCANGNTLRFESAAIVDALGAGGYAKEGAGRVVTVTPKGRRYLRSEEARVRLAFSHPPRHEQA